MRFVKSTSIKIGLAMSFAEEKPNDMLYQDGFYDTFLISIDPSISEQIGLMNGMGSKPT